MTRSSGLGRRLLRTKEAAAYLSVSLWKLRRLVQDGLLTIVQEGEGAAWRIDVCDLDEFIERNKRMFRLGLQATPAKVLRLPKIPRLREDNVRTGFLEDGQYRKLVEYCPELWFRAMVEVRRTYGWRVSEVRGMRVSQLDLLQRTIRLEPGTTKNREGREVSMTESAYSLLRECAHGKAPDAFVFTRPNGKPIRNFRKLWANACAFAGCPGLLFHDLRRTAARNLRRAGVAEGLIMRIGGWKTRSVFERYNIITQSDIKDAMTKLQVSEKELKQQQEEQQKERESNFGHVFGHVGPAKKPTAVN